MQITGSALYPTEKENCQSLTQQLPLLHRQGLLIPCVWFHVANEGDVGKAYMSLLLSMGLKPGASDYVFMAMNKNLCLEMKGHQKPKLKGGIYRVNQRTGRYYQRKGRLQKNQKEFRAGCEECGVPYEVAWFLYDAYAALDKHGFLPYGLESVTKFLALNPES